MSNVPSLVKASFLPSDDSYYSQGQEAIIQDDEMDKKSIKEQWNRLWANQIYNITCKWEPLRKQMLMQWNQLTARELDEAGPNRQKLASLVNRKYGVSIPLVENYLRNFERTLPLL
jgi:hypothetical protein